MNQRPYKLQYLPLFWDDLNNAVSYISNTLHSPKAAERFVDEVEAKILDYSFVPTSAPLYGSTKQRALPYHWFPVGNYMVFYVAFDNVMEVRRLLYGSRDLTRFIP